MMMETPGENHADLLKQQEKTETWETRDQDRVKDGEKMVMKEEK